MPIQAEVVIRKLADPFDYGGAHMNPDRAVDPGLVYDIDPKEYTKFFTCTLGPKDDCSSYTVPYLRNPVTVWCTVTNVGPLRATYRAAAEASVGVNIAVNPLVINFKKGSTSATFKVTFTARHRIQGCYIFGSLTWFDGRNHSVSIPIAVRTVI
ncbi:hypothetical protein HU200_018541 [Digitaria exilis]|uniref:Subtilisin-like protease fibronectin type-III domain-containing protein n=1 Tax=Digitaria exilis TaxID=1010633 RepID=A0A835F4Q1_9POAL|nr:hypothetical protein HU200_018541 [Digitaria exilis]